jgi:hypothetical protein
MNASASVLARLARQQASRPQGGGGNRVKGIYHNWKDGSNIIRLVGDYVEVRTHFIAPSPKRKDRGLCQASSFQGEEKLPQVINCLDWDIATEHPKKTKTCPICKLNAVARAVLAEKENPPTDEEKKFFEALRSATRSNVTNKWNILDRDDPFVIETKDSKEEQVLGFKIASIGPEATNDIFGIFKQVGRDTCGPDDGIDIEVIRDSKGARTTYSARAVIAGTSLKVTPLTAEERALELHDLKVRCGKQVDADKIIDAMHEDLRKIIEIPVGETADAPEVDSAIDEAVVEVAEEKPAPKAAVAAPAKTATPPTRPATQPAQAAQQPAAAAPASKVPSSVLNRLGKQPVATAPAEAAAIDEAIGEDDGEGDGGLLDDTKKN